MRSSAQTHFLVSLNVGCRRLLTLWVFWLLGSAAAAGASEVGDRNQGQAERRVVAVGDIHGALEPFQLILRQAGLTDEQDRWVGGTDILVQTGDFLDRGPGAKDAAELLRRLQKEAPKQGGEVIVLLGNHEALNLFMDLRDVTPEIAQRFQRKRSTKRRETHCRRNWTRQRNRGGAVTDWNEYLETCRREVPLGLLEYVESIGPNGDLGKWFRKLPIIAKVEGWLFVHGGLSPAYGDRSWKTLNEEAAAEIESFDRLRSGLLYRELISKSSQLKEILGVSRALHMVMTERDTPIRTPTMDDMAAASRLTESVLFGADGPLWFRGYSRWQEEEGSAAISAILEAQNAKGVVVAHTPQTSRSIGERFDGRVFLIDTGMLTAAYKGRPSALELVGDRISAIYLDERVTLSPVEPAEADGAPDHR